MPTTDQNGVGLPRAIPGEDLLLLRDTSVGIGLPSEPNGYKIPRHCWFTHSMAACIPSCIPLFLIKEIIF